jgi:hypothetical protein
LELSINALTSNDGSGDARQGRRQIEFVRAGRALSALDHPPAIHQTSGSPLSQE